MKNLVLVFFLLIFVLGACTNQGKHEPETVVENAIFFDSTLAKEYGADDYGMKKYCMAFLYAGENRETDSTKAAALQRAHMDNISRMADEGKLLLAGPFFGEGPLRGIYVFDVPSLEEAQALTATDPAIQSGHLRMEILEWYASAAMMALPEIHEKVAKIKF